MHEKVGIKIDVLQFAKLKKILPKGEVSSWISEAICDLLLVEKSKPFELSFFCYGKKTNNTRSVYCWLSPYEIESLTKVTERLKKENKSFSRTFFVSESIERRLKLIGSEERKSIVKKHHFETRIDLKIKSKIKESTRKRKGRKKQLISHWLAEAAAELLKDKVAVDPFVNQEVNWEHPVTTSVAVTEDLKKKIKRAVEKLKKSNSKFSIALWITEAARRKIKREKQ